MKRSRRCQEAIKRAGGAAKVASFLGLTKPAVYMWKEVPLAHVYAMSKLSGMAGHEMRPDHYDPPPRESAA